MRSTSFTYVLGEYAILVPVQNAGYKLGVELFRRFAKWSCPVKVVLKPGKKLRTPALPPPTPLSCMRVRLQKICVGSAQANKGTFTYFFGGNEEEMYAQQTD